MALLLHVDDFEVADGGLAARAPVDDVCAAIDQPLLVKADEGLTHGDRQPLVHGEVLALPIDRGSQPLHLAENGAAIVTLPLPYALDEGLAAKLLAARSFAGQLPLHQHLCRNAGMIRAGHPQNPVAAHAPPAHKDVTLRMLEHV